MEIRLGNRRPARADDEMGRTWVGFDPREPLDVLFEQNRGRWRVDKRRALEQDYVLFTWTGDSVVKFVADIEGLEDVGNGKSAIVGSVLPPEHPASDWVGRTLERGTQNPVRYLRDSTEPRTCACGCGTQVTPARRFAAGHDRRAVNDRIVRGWGSALGFIEWFDHEGHTTISRPLDERAAAGSAVPSRQG